MSMPTYFVKIGCPYCLNVKEMEKPDPVNSPPISSNYCTECDSVFYLDNRVVLLMVSTRKEEMSSSEKEKIDHERLTEDFIYALNYDVEEDWAG